ncbi:MULTISPECIES: PTS glucose transporter subunit IIA [unclassified Enterococcus]|uniref:PTS sugar transporter subunit IIA n=1 Tax=unclassified Enterococcus TaxID=2608891 RepID=UPI0013E9B724|nr:MULTISPECIES: PTS glucose transporter subunit IIA [unclassified Enterococcus]
MLWKRKQTLRAIASGKVIPLEAVGDGVFSMKMMGDGFAVSQHNGQIYSPIAGIVKMIFPTKHAITIESNDGTVLLIHMGIDTVELKGIPFSLKVREGQSVSSKTLLAEIDMEKLDQENKDTTVLVVLPDGPKGKLVKVNKQVSVNEKVFVF